MSKERSFICTGNGFIKSIDKVIDTTSNKKFINIEYCNTLISALKLSHKEARKLIDTWNIDGFVYQPYAEYINEESKTKKYCVKYCSEDYLDDNSIKTFRPRKHYSNRHDSDVKYLNNGMKTCDEEVDMMTYEDAIKKADELNLKLIDRIQKRILNKITDSNGNEVIENDII